MDMKKLLVSSALLLAVSLSSYTQPLIEKDDMPSAGDTIRLSFTSNINSIDYTLTGQNFIWDFSSLTEQTQRVDTFVSVLSTPIAYQLFFNDPFDQAHKASVAQPQPDISFFSYVQFTKVYNYFKAATASYTQVGQGATVNGVPTSIRYDDPDLLYNFPISSG